MNVFQLGCVFIESLKEDIHLDDFLDWIEQTHQFVSRARNVLDDSYEIEYIHGGLAAIWKKEDAERSDWTEMKNDPDLNRLLNNEWPEQYRSVILYTNYLVPEELAKEALDHAISQYEHSRNQINQWEVLVVGADLPSAQMDNYDILSERMSKFINYLKEGNYDASRIFFSQLHAAFRYGNAGIHPREFYAMVIATTLVQLGHYTDKEVRRLVTAMQDTILSGTWYRFVLMEIYKVCQFNGQIHSYRFDTFEQKVHRLIDFEITDPKLDLKTAADFFGLTPNYFSQQFKQHMGEGFLAYVERHRMNIGFDLLGQRDMTVAKAAIACGYDNVSSFRRNFKEHFGINPGEVRK